LGLVSTGWQQFMTTLKYQITLLLWMLVTLTSFGQKEQARFLLAFSDSVSGNELWGFKTASGQIVIKPKYENVGTDTLYNMAISWF
jgi:hypothetical protein